MWSNKIHVFLVTTTTKGIKLNIQIWVTSLSGEYFSMILTSSKHVIYCGPHIFNNRPDLINLTQPINVILKHWECRCASMKFCLYLTRIDIKHHGLVGRWSIWRFWKLNYSSLLCNRRRKQIAIHLLGQIKTLNWQNVQKETNSISRNLCSHS